MTFLQLIDEYAVIIPVIQRDYAQGRLSERVTDLRKRFVADLVSFLCDAGKKSHDLDAVYGSTKDGQFVPLDGQQRLTTLFLLHLYLSGMRGEESFAKYSKALSGRFSYKTRHSSTMFCDNIIKYNVFKEFDDMRRKASAAVQQDSVETEKHHQPSLSEIIKNQWWFFEVWQQDPTVSGMLVMLDAIDDEFQKSSVITVSEAYDSLFGDSGSCPPITFLMLPLDGYSRKDDLYIKMNARGVHLTDFENFKARFEELLSSIDPSRKNDVSKKLDIEWSEALWRYRGKADNTDWIIEKIIRFTIACSYRGTGSALESADVMEYLLEQNKKRMRFTFSRYCDLGVFHKKSVNVSDEIIQSELEVINNIVSFLDIISLDENSPLLGDECTSKWQSISTSAHELFLKGTSLEYSPRLRLYAYLKYISIHRGAVISDDQHQWMRLICNLDEATPINNAYEFNRACVSVDSMLKAIGNKTVLDWLASQRNSRRVPWFRSYQFIEECVKARMLLLDTDNKDTDEKVKSLIVKCESHPYLKGQIAFLLYYSHFMSDFGIKDLKELSAEQYVECYTNFKKYAEKSLAIFDTFGIEDGSNPIKDEFLLERALLSKGDYLKRASAGRANFCNNPFDRDYSWKTMLVVDTEDNKNKRTLRVFRTLLDDIDQNNLEQSLRDVISNATDDGSYLSLLRNNPKLIKYCTQGFITIASARIQTEWWTDIVLLGQSQMNHYHSELRTRDLYERKKDPLPFIRYKEVKKWEDDNSLYFRFIEDGRKYRFNIYQWENRWWYDITNDNTLDEAVIPDIVKDKFSNIDCALGGESILTSAISIVGESIDGYVSAEDENLDS